ncbi:uncharacterized protein LOC131877345 isoform X3 [Tigriopus californicus]|uniref:uncharacterized protein LOC131877345 isoform X3 n=1 Tax=Tigriopus californicus TaxID=6832 RepID=UPI0027D9FAA7|nr:uncharacterized protein LOC131877345 isoform X3 [Tigriopus californicus]
MISGQVCMAGRLHPTVQSKRTNLPGHWTKWTAPAVIPKITGSCFFAVCLVALFFPAGGHTKALAKRPPSFDFSRPIITPKMMSSLSSPTNDCFKINSSTPLAELNGFFKKYPTGNLVQIKSGKNKQKTLSVNPMSYEVVWTGKDPKNNASKSTFEHQGTLTSPVISLKMSSLVGTSALIVMGRYTRYWTSSAFSVWTVIGNIRRKSKYNLRAFILSASSQKWILLEQTSGKRVLSLNLNALGKRAFGSIARNPQPTSMMTTNAVLK